MNATNKEIKTFAVLGRFCYSGRSLHKMKSIKRAPEHRQDKYIFLYVSERGTNLSLVTGLNSMSFQTQCNKVMKNAHC